MNSQHRST